MPKGQAAVIWTSEKDAKMLLAILAVLPGKLDYDAVAKHFSKLNGGGNDIPGSCIATRIQRLRRSVNGGKTTPTSRKDTPKSTTLKDGSAKKRKRDSQMSDDESEEMSVEPSSSEHEVQTNKPRIESITPDQPRRAIKYRTTPRKFDRIDYGKLNGDADDELTNGEGNKIFSTETEAGDDDIDDDDDDEAFGGAMVGTIKQEPDMADHNGLV